MIPNYKQVYDKRFIKKLKKRGKIRKFIEWITIGTIAFGVVHTWSWDGKVVQRETSYIEKNIEKVSEIVPAILGSVLVFFTNPGTIVWPVPKTWNNFNNTIECIGAGGAGAPGAGPGNYEGGGGGGGGAYSRSTNYITFQNFLYVNVGKGGVLDGVGGHSWICFASAEPINSDEGVLARGGLAGKGYIIGPNSAVGGAGGAAVSCIFNDTSFDGGDGGTETGGVLKGGGGGGAAGPNGAGVNATYSGGAGDNNSGGVGGTVPVSQAWGNNGANGAEWISHLGNTVAIVGSGGGGSGALSSAGVAQQGGNGGNYGGGGGGGAGGLGGGGSGANGLVIISYVPALPVCDKPQLPPVTPPSYGPGPSLNQGAIAGVSPGTQAQFFWTYGTWVDTFGSDLTHFDGNYNKLATLTGDDNSVNFDDNYHSETNWNIKNETENEYHDVPRVWKSRSNEWLDNGGTRSVWCRHRCSIDNSVVVPDIDPPASYITLTTNLLFMDEQTFGYRLSYTKNNGFFLTGDTVVQQLDSTSYSYGTVYQMDPNFIYVYVCSGAFIPNLSVYNLNIPTINTYITSSSEMNEKFTANVFPGQSRYMCKSVILATGQDAEDLQVYLGAYRPGNTNFKVYGKVINAQDTTLYSDKIWSRLIESDTTSTLFSSFSNLQNYIELIYDLPTSQLLFSNTDGCTVNSASTFIIMPATDVFYSGSYAYLTDPSTGSFNVRLVSSVVNSTALMLQSTPSFSNTSNANIGIIPGLEDQTGAFLYDQNNNIMRYVTSEDIYYDSFNQFAIKIVPTSDNPVIVPRAKDMRALALQV